ncbi:hypothetical protein D3C77_681120 [compost metagenome]
MGFSAAVTGVGYPKLFLFELHAEQALERLGAAGFTQSIGKARIGNGRQDGDYGDHDHQL